MTKRDVWETAAAYATLQAKSKQLKQEEASVIPGGETRGEGVLFRVLLLYGAYNLFHNLAFLLGYHLLPPGAMKGTHPACVIASRVAASSNWWAELGGTLLMNLLVMGSICISLNL